MLAPVVVVRPAEAVPAPACGGAARQRTDLCGYSSREASVFTRGIFRIDTLLSMDIFVTIER